MVVRRRLRTAMRLGASGGKGLGYLASFDFVIENVRRRCVHLLEGQ